MFRLIAKYATALFYVLGGPLIHIYLITQRREIYAAVDDLAVPLYQTIWTVYILPNIVPLAILLMLFEITAGVLMFSRNPKYAQLGHLAGLVFNLLLVPFLFSYGIPNLLLVALHAWLLHEEHVAPIAKLHPAH